MNQEGDRATDQRAAIGDPAQAMTQTARFTGKVAFVTGASSGIRRATAQAFAREGASTIGHAMIVDGGQTA